MVVSVAIGTFEGAETVVALITRKDAVLTADDARHQVAIFVGISYALKVDDALGRGREVGPDIVKHLLDGSYLIHRHRGSGIALYAADAFTLFVVTAEHFRDDVGGNQNAGDVNDGGDLSHFKLEIRN